MNILDTVLIALEEEKQQLLKEKIKNTSQIETLETQLIQAWHDYEFSEGCIFLAKHHINRYQNNLDFMKKKNQHNRYNRTSCFSMEHIKQRIEKLELEVINRQALIDDAKETIKTSTDQIVELENENSKIDEIIEAIDQEISEKKEYISPRQKVFTKNNIKNNEKE